MSPVQQIRLNGNALYRTWGDWIALAVDEFV
jgi:hypothetical protein